VILGSRVQRGETLQSRKPNRGTSKKEEGGGSPKRYFYLGSKQALKRGVGKTSIRPYREIRYLASVEKESGVSRAREGAKLQSKRNVQLPGRASRPVKTNRGGRRGSTGEGVVVQRSGTSLLRLVGPRVLKGGCWRGGWGVKEF